MHDVCFTPAHTLARLIRSKELSPVEVVQAFVDRIAAVNPQVNAYCLVAAESALTAARAAEQAIMRGESAGPLHGVPLAIKDLVPTAGLRTTMGSRAFADYVPDHDGVLVQRVKAAGAIVLGKTNVPEMGFKGTTDNALFGATKNPWHLGRTAGGSSGGAAAAIAAGLAPLADGTDGGGSIRVPAAACGVFGLKPTFGLVPMDVGSEVTKFSHHTPMVCAGPITRTVADAALMLGVIAGPHPSDPMSLPAVATDFAAGLAAGVSGLKIAYSVDLGYFPIDPAVRAATDAAARVYADLGSTVDPVDPGFTDPAENLEQAFMTTYRVFEAAFTGPLLDQWADQMTPELVAIARSGMSVSAMAYKQLDTARTMVWDRLQAIFDRYDLLLTPTLGTTAFPLGLLGPSAIDGRPIDPFLGWALTYPFNWTGHPAASLPCGFTDEGLPVGLQIIGPRFADALVLRAAAAFEQARPWADRRPVCC